MNKLKKKQLAKQKAIKSKKKIKWTWNSNLSVGHLG